MWPLIGIPKEKACATMGPPIKTGVQIGREMRVTVTSVEDYFFRGGERKGLKKGT
jgi:hypothetical protein